MYKPHKYNTAIIKNVFLFLGCRSPKRSALQAACAGGDPDYHPGGACAPSREGHVMVTRPAWPERLSRGLYKGEQSSPLSRGF